jgi:hypothetical protein
VSHKLIVCVFFAGDHYIRVVVTMGVTAGWLVINLPSLSRSRRLHSRSVQSSVDHIIPMTIASLNVSQVTPWHPLFSHLRGGSILLSSFVIHLHHSIGSDKPNECDTLLTTLQIRRKDNKGRRRSKGVTIKIVRLGVRNFRHDSKLEDRHHSW